MFFKNPTPEYKEDSPVNIDHFMASGEYDQGDKAIIAYDDLYNKLQEAYKQGKRDEGERVWHLAEGMKETRKGINIPSEMDKSDCVNKGYEIALTSLQDSINK